LEQATVTKTSRLGAAALLVFLASLATYLPPALVNEAPFWDDKAYINNALIFSGRLSPQDVRGPYAEERPPLFWWLLTGLYAFKPPRRNSPAGLADRYRGRCNRPFSADLSDF
jgi:hypothetical protein